jgi:hypothetical protein
MGVVCVDIHVYVCGWVWVLNCVCVQMHIPSSNIGTHPNLTHLAIARLCPNAAPSRRVEVPSVHDNGGLCVCGLDI